MTLPLVMAFISAVIAYIAGHLGHGISASIWGLIAFGFIYLALAWGDVE